MPQRLKFCTRRESELLAQRLGTTMRLPRHDHSKEATRLPIPGP
jgi:hypothetical protein